MEMKLFENRSVSDRVAKDMEQLIDIVADLNAMGLSSDVNRLEQMRLTNGAGNILNGLHSLMGFNDDKLSYIDKLMKEVKANV